MSSQLAAQQALDVCADPAAAPTEYDFARAVILTARYAGVTIGSAESLTGGLASQLLTSVPGASEVFRGGVVAYTADVKERLLRVPASALERLGTVDPEIALAMARGAAELLDVDVAVACTGVAGPDSHSGKPVGEVHLAVYDRSASSSRVNSLRLGGTRDDIRAQSAISMCGLLLDALLPHTDLDRG